VTSAVSEHLRRLAVVANEIAAVIDAEQPGRPLPTMELCRCAVTADGAMATLHGHLLALQSVQMRDDATGHAEARKRAIARPAPRRARNDLRNRSGKR
jgi:hypothetical protein